MSLCISHYISMCVAHTRVRSLTSNRINPRLTVSVAARCVYVVECALALTAPSLFEMIAPQVRLLQRAAPVAPGPALVLGATAGARGRRHARLRVDRARHDLRVERHPVLRGHLPGRQPAAQGHPLLDQSHLLRPLRHRDAAQVDRPRLLALLHQFLDRARLHHCLCEYSRKIMIIGQHFA